jgi:hypothetical protein
MAGAGAGERPEIALDPGLLTSARHSLKSLRRIREQAAAQLREATGEPKEAAAPADAKARPVEPATGARSLAVPAAERLEAWQPDLEIRYRPYWHVRSRRFGIYAPEARLTLTGAAPAPYGEEDYDEELQEAVDRLVLLQGRRELEQAVNTGTAAVVAVPVHYTTLAQIGSRRRYLDLCRNIRAADRAYILWQIMGVPREAFQGQLRSFVEVLRPFGRSLSLVLTLTEQTYPHLPRDLPLVALAGVAAVGLDARRTGASEKDLIQLFDYLVKLGTETNLKPYVTGLQTSSLVIAAACAGFEYVAGPAVAEPQPRLEGIRDAPLEQIYLKTLQTGAA